MKGVAFFAYADNYLIDVKCGVIMGVEASRAIQQAEVGASQTMIEQTEERFGLKPKWLAADTAYGSGANLNWLVKDKEIAPHIPVIDKSKREDGTVRQGAQHLCLPSWQDPRDDWQVGQRWGDPSLYREHVRLS